MPIVPDTLLNLTCATFGIPTGLGLRLVDLAIEGSVGHGKDILGTKDVADVGPCNVPMYNFDICKDQGQGVNVTVSSPAPGVVQFDSIPPTCMDLVTVMTASCNGYGGQRPTLCGSACVKYEDLSVAQLTWLQTILTA